MADAVILVGASKSNTTGGTMADSLSANSGDSLTIPTTPSGIGTLFAMWAIDSDSVMEGEIYGTRVESFGDTQTGYKWETPALALGGAATNAAFTIFKKNIQVPVYSGDTLTINVTTTAADDAAWVGLFRYTDLPGIGENSQFTDWGTVQSLRKSNRGFALAAVASATPGSWGAARAVTADDNRFSANTYYALLGVTVRTQVTAVSFISNVWGGQRIGLPAGSLDMNTSEWFAQLSEDQGLPLIPYFAQADAANISCYVMDAEANTSPHIALNLVELKGQPA